MPGNRGTRTAKARHYKRSLREKFFLRFHMSLILGAVVLSGVLANSMLTWVGLDHIVFRYTASVVLSYGVFFVCIRLWLAYIHTSSDTGEVIEDMAFIVTEEAAYSSPDIAFAAMHSSDYAYDGGGSSSGSSGGIGGLFDGVDSAEGALILFLLAVVVAVICGAGVYLIWEAPLILSEAAFQAMLATALIRSSQRMDHAHWFGSVFRATWIPFGAVLAITAVFTLTAHHFCPTATDIAQVQQCAMTPNAESVD